ncbi:MAG: hypothetical protein Q8L08_08495 [Candidatus Nanopelagicaceae bacterium]|nr:hypothetical protein [Candidatus Nanopelagicaceae bacterium]
MKVERKANKVDEADVFYVEQSDRQPPQTSTSRRSFRRFVYFVIAVILSSSLAFGIFSYLDPPHLDLKYALLATNGKVALSEAQLRDVVAGEGLDVYWLGPQEGALYALDSVSTTQNYVRYLPNGNGLEDTAPNYRVIGTYVTKDAFSVTLSNAKKANSVAFTNEDGNAVYYGTLNPNSVYVGVKGTDSQIEIFDPNSGLALIAARTPKLLQKIS